MSGPPALLRPVASSPTPQIPPPFLRRPSSVSSSSFLSTTTSSVSDVSSDEDSSEYDDSDDDARTESYWSSSGLSGDEGRFAARLDFSLRAPHASPVGAASSAGGSNPLGQSGSPSPNARSNLRLSLAVLRARQSLAAQSYDSLAAALKALSAALPPLSSLVRRPTSGAENPLGIFVPTLARLAADVRTALRDEGDKGREFRRTKLTREDAKALVGLRQKWCTGISSGLVAGSKGKGREPESLEWPHVVEAAAEPNPLPASLTGDERFATLDRALLTSLEAFLLPSSLPRISLSKLGLTDTDVADWPALRRLRETIVWYLSFVVAEPEEASTRAHKALDGVKSLDLSKNRLTTFPLYLPRLLPHLETLSLSHNQFTHLPPWVTLFSALRRLRTHGNRLVSARKALKPLASAGSEWCNQRKRPHAKQAGTRADVRDALPAVRTAVLESPIQTLLPPNGSTGPSTLFYVAAEVLHAQIASTQLEYSAAGEDAVPPHLQEVLSRAYRCTSCARFILPSCGAWIQPFTERAHHLDPGISLPSRLVPPSMPMPALFSPPTTPPLQPHPEHLARPLSAAERPATLEQRLLLALLARLDAPPPRPPPPPQASRRRDSDASLSSLASSPHAPRASLPPRRRRHDQGASHDRVPALPTLVLGAPEWRFCALCAAAHLGMEEVLALRADAEAVHGDTGSARMEGPEAATLRRWKCGCVVCLEERRVRGLDEVPGECAAAGATGEARAKVLRWFRRKEQPREETVKGAASGVRA